MNRIEASIACVALTGALLYTPAQKLTAPLSQAKNFVLAQLERPADPVNVPVTIFAATEQDALPDPVPAPIITATVPEPPAFAAEIPAMPHASRCAMQERAAKLRQHIALQRADAATAYLRSTEYREQMKRFTSPAFRTEMKRAYINTPEFKEQQRRLAHIQSEINHEVVKSLENM